MSWPMMSNQLSTNVFTRCFTHFFGWGYGSQCAIPLIVFDCERRVLQYQCAIALHIPLHRDVAANASESAVERRTGIWRGSETNGARHRQSRRAFPAWSLGLLRLCRRLRCVCQRFLCFWRLQGGGGFIGPRRRLLGLCWLQRSVGCVFRVFTREIIRFDQHFRIRFVRCGGIGLRRVRCRGI